MGVFVVLVEPTLIHVEAPPSVMGNIEAGRRRGAAPGQDAQPEVAFYVADHSRMNCLCSGVCGGFVASRSMAMV
jgi:hypothetical protein